MKTKLILFALAVVLLASLVAPALVAAPAHAWERNTTTSTTTTKMGPLMIGIGLTDSKFVGIAVSITLKGTELKIANIRGLSLDGTFTLCVNYGEPYYIKPSDPNPFMIPITSGAVKGTGSLPSGNTVVGSLSNLGVALSKPELAGGYIAFFDTFASPSYGAWGGMWLEDLGIMTLLPTIIKGVGGPDLSFLDGTIQKLVPILNSVIGPILKNHPIVVIMPQTSLFMMMPLMGY